MKKTAQMSTRETLEKIVKELSRMPSQAIYERGVMVIRRDVLKIVENHMPPKRKKVASCRICADMEDGGPCSNCEILKRKKAKVKK